MMKFNIGSSFVYTLLSLILSLNSAQAMNSSHQESRISQSSSRPGNIVRNRLPHFISNRVDHLFHDLARTIALRSGHFVRNEIQNLFYNDPNGAYIEVQGVKHPVRYPRSHVVDNIFRQVIGSTLTEQIQTLPFGVRHVSDFTRKKLEALVVEKVIGELARWGVEETVERALLTAYGFKKNQIHKMMGSHYEARKALSNTSSQNSIESLYQDLKFTEADLIELEQESQQFADIEENSFQVEDELVNADAAEFELPETDFSSDPFVEISNSSNSEDISFQDVMDYYNDRIANFLNQFLRDKLVEAVALASREVCNTGTHSFTQYVQMGQLGACVLTGCPVVGLGCAFVLEKTKDSIQQFVGQRAYSFAKRISSRSFPNEILKSKQSGIAVQSSASSLSSEASESIQSDWIEVVKKEATLQNWGRQIVRYMASELFQKFNPGYDPGNASSIIRTEPDYVRPFNPEIISPEQDDSLPYHRMTDEEFDSMTDQEHERYEGLLEQYERQCEEDRQLRKKIAFEAAREGARRMNRNQGFLSRLWGSFIL